MEKFKEMVSLCKFSVEIEVNGHRDFCSTVLKHIPDEYLRNINDDVLSEMINTDTIVFIQAYPRSAIGFYAVYHYDIDQALDIMIELIKKEPYA